MSYLFPHLEGVKPATQFATLEEQASAAEAWTCAPWAAAAILTVEICTPIIVDPCCGTGIMSEAAIKAGYTVESADLYDWGYPCITGVDFLTDETSLEGKTVFMNPPFSLAVEFILAAIRRGARKVICYQRWAFRESNKRRDFWEKHKPARSWICGDRAHTWLLHIPPEERTSSGKETAHGFFVWEAGQNGADRIGTIWKDMAR
ncbi:MAG: hypothetical protein ACPGOV_11745 [Magnetovibrionaceae bacterium]